MSEKKEKIYLLNATWQDERGDYHHRMLHTSANSVEEMFEKLAKEYPEWKTTNDYTKVGEILGFFTSVTVFETVSYDDRSWWDWKRQKQLERRDQIEVEKRERDLQTIRDLVKKHGFAAMEVLAMAADGNQETC